MTLGACAIAVMCFLSVITKAQVITGLNRDSLKKVIAANPGDTATVYSLVHLGQQYENNTPDSAVYYYKKANELSERLHFPAGIITYINNYTAVLNVQGKFDQSLALHSQALALAEKYGLQALRLKTLLNMGVVYQYKEDYQAAAAHYLNSLPLFEQIGDKQSLSSLYGNLCGLYRNLDQPTKAIFYARKALNVAETLRDEYVIGQANNNLGNALMDTGNFNEARACFNRAYNIGIKTNDMNMQETSLINLGDLLSKNKDPESYIPVFKRALPLADSLGDVYGKSLVLQGIASGLFRQKKFEAAKEQAEQSLQYAHNNGQKETESKALQLLSDVQIALGDIASADRYRQMYDSVYSAIVNPGLKKNIQELEAKYELEKKQSQILRQSLLIEQNNRLALRQRTWLWVSLAGIVLLLAVLLWANRYYRQRQLLNEKTVETLKAEQENVRLKAQLEGQQQERQRIGREMHDDMGSGLTSMLFLSRQVNNNDKAALRINETAEELVQKMNEIIWAMNHEQDTLESLVAYTRKQIAELLDVAGINYKFTVTGNITTQPVGQLFRRNIYLAAKEAVHNIIRHSKAGFVQININIKHDLLSIAIIDDGKGFLQHSNRPFGNGLKNMQQRMEDIKGSFTIENAGARGTSVLLAAPLTL